MAAEPLGVKKEPVEPSALARIWADLVAAGWREAVLRYATHGVLLLVLINTPPSSSYAPKVGSTRLKS